MRERLEVLVVDDDRRMARTMGDILKANGCEVIEAGSGEEALEKLGSHMPDCVFMDIKMPGLSGIEMVKIIKGMAPDLPVILMSAYATEDQVVEAKAYGAWTVLDKPIDIQAVLAFMSVLKKEKSILVVDDDSQFCKTLKDILESRGYKVETETDPEEVLGDMEREYKLVVLLDLKLGSKDGTEVLIEIRAKYPAKPVIVITGYGEEMASSIEKARRIGAHACLYKPLEIDALVEQINEIDRRKLKELLGEKADIQED